MRVVITHRSFIDRIGGVVTFVLELSEALINMKHEVYIIDFSHIKSSKDLKELYDVERVPPILSLKRHEAKDIWPPRGSSVKDFTIWLLRGSRIVRDLEPDIVIVNGVVPRTKAPSSTYVAVAHAVHPHLPSSPLARLMLKKLYEANDYIVAITEREKRTLTECLDVEETKLKVISLCLNVERYKRRDLGDRDKVLPHVGTHGAKIFPQR